MRIISSDAKQYSPAGYHFGSVWPLFTGWASLAEYHSHAELAAFANLKANSWLTLDGANRNPTEVLSGETYSPLSTASPHQIWSAAMVISSLLRGTFGVEVDAVNKRIRLAPHLPADWHDAALRHVPIAGGFADFIFHRDQNMTSLEITTHGASPFHLTFAPAFSPYVNVKASAVNNTTTRVTRQDERLDWHAVTETDIGTSGATIALRHDRYFGISAADAIAAPKLGEASSNLKLLSQYWADGNKRVSLVFSGLTGRHYAFQVQGADQIANVRGGQRQGSNIEITMPNGTGYVKQTVEISLK
jgi:hypothetical protein